MIKISLGAGRDPQPSHRSRLGLRLSLALLVVTTFTGHASAQDAAAPAIAEAPSEEVNVPRLDVLPLDEATPLSRIAFGSCAHQDRPQPIWDAVVAQDPQVFIFGGDNTYTDLRELMGLPGLQRFAHAYQTLAAHPGFQRLVANVPLLATWDDHDYGLNDAGISFEHKVRAQELFLNFWGVADDSPRREQEGVYSSRIIGPEGQRVQIILLDTRYFRTDMTQIQGPNGRAYVPSSDRNQSVLGDAQWEWLGQVLREPAEVRLIITSIQLQADQHRFEKWANFPRERQRMARLLGSGGIGGTPIDGVILISGDRHHAEISQFESVPPSYPIYEVTASGLNQSRGEITEPNDQRVAGPYSNSHFGLITIDWEQEPAQVSLGVHDVDGAKVFGQDVTMDELTSVPMDYTNRIAVDLPEGYADPSHPMNATDGEGWPLVLFLHGAGERGDDLAQIRLHGPPKLIDAGHDLPAVVVCPQVPLNRWWDARGLVALLDQLEADYRIDPNRIYVTGLSMGGYGSWALASLQPDRLAALAPICGMGDPSAAHRLIDLPVWAFHGDADRVVDVSGTTDMVAAIEAAGGTPQQTIYEGVGHDSWTATYENEAFWAWMFAQRRVTD